MYDLSRPFSFHIELTDKCNARCVQCSRNFVDDLGNLNERPNLCLTEITIDQYKDIFKDYLHKTKTINFCGNMGDPLFAKDILAITESYLKEFVVVFFCFGKVWLNLTQGMVKN